MVLALPPAQLLAGAVMLQYLPGGGIGQLVALPNQDGLGDLTVAIIYAPNPGAAR